MRKILTTAMYVAFVTLIVVGAGGCTVWSSIDSTAPQAAAESRSTINTPDTPVSPTKTASTRGRTYLSAANE